MNLQHICTDTYSIAAEVAQFMRNEVGKVITTDISDKSINNFVSYVDKESEKRLIEQLGKLIPGAAFYAEEGTVERSTTGLHWIIDPLDGTTNFLHQLPIYSISIALCDGPQPLIGMVYDVPNNKCYHAWKDGGAWCDDRRLNVSKADKIMDSLLVTGFPYDDFSLMDAYMNLLKHLWQHSRGIRRLGSAAMDLAYVASGSFESFFEYSLAAWDVAGGGLLVQEAGGIVTDFSGGDNWIHGGEIIASAPGVHKEMLGLVNEYF